ncbi:MAG TPA: hypothetical protein VF145_05125 [Chitinophagaceae bacterium]
MKFIVAVLLTMLLSFAAGLFPLLPWWSFAVCAFIVALAIHQRAWKAFLAGFLALAVLWSVLSLYIDTQNDHILSSKVATLFSLGSSVALILIAALASGLVAGFAAMAGSYLRKR